MKDFITTHSETLIGMIGGLMITLLLLMIQWLLKEARIRSALKPLIGTYTVYLISGELKEGSNGEVELDQIYIFLVKRFLIFFGGGVLLLIVYLT